MKHLRLALVGCGQIADAHLQEMRKLTGVEVVGVCDIHQDLADQAALRFDVPHAFHDIDELLSQTSPDVVHLTTPAHTHFPLSVKLVEAGVHVYVEKPFTLDAIEAQRLIDIAHKCGRLVCVGHDQLFDPAWMHCCTLVDQGAVGDVTHVESILGYPLSGQFGRQVTTDRNHWVRKLPGGLFQNTISHPLYRITEFLTDERPAVAAQWFMANAAATFPTELVVQLRGERVTGALTFSTRIEPQRTTRIYGTRGALEVDLDSQMVRRIRQSRLPGAFAKIEAPLRQCADAAGNLKRNAVRFLKGEIHYFSGMGELFERFYQSIRDGAPSPIPEAEALRVTRVMDEIFRQCRGENEFRRTVGMNAQPVELIHRRSSDETSVGEHPSNERSLAAARQEVHP